ncbi:hypothetical protein [Mycobacterium avium]|uniref:hypothetical protein n=1 Tax=Mycobacterium avium TaxID=1764 RepID=UPI001CDAB577|nr:hypothetical protein [Mycobacterium avium]
MRALIRRIRRRPPHRTKGRLADVHMWTIRDGWTSRAQAFRDETGRTFAVITRRAGDTGPGHINGAEMFRGDAWAQFFPDEPAPPILAANVLDPPMSPEGAGRFSGRGNRGVGEQRGEASFVSPVS